MTPSNHLNLQCTSLAAELKYAHSTHQVALITKDEASRQLAVQLLIAQHDIDQLGELLAQEEVRSDGFEAAVTANLSRAQTAEARVQHVEHMLRETEAEMGTLRAESRALQLSAADSEAFLTEKLALTRELSTLRPQIEHWKQQAQDSERLLAEKLELQRSLSDAQCEAENFRRDAKRALAKRRNTGVEIAQEEEVAMLKRDLAREKRARLRAEEAASVTTPLQVGGEDIRTEWAREKRARQNAEEELEALRQEREREKQGRIKAERASRKVAEDAEATKATLDEKLGQFRNKLKTTKEKLKETQAELAALLASNAAAKSTAAARSTTAANPKKRPIAAASWDADATTLGTPGDGNPAATKRGRKAAPPGVGDKSTFSITPFLNRTTTILPEDSPVIEEAADEEMEESVEAQPNSPILAKKVPLTQISTNTKKSAAAPPQRKTGGASKKTALDAVVEEDDDHVGIGQENAIVHQKTKTIKTKVVDGSGDEEEAPAKKEKRKKRKSLADFKSFDTEPEVSKKSKAGQKSRKLGGGASTIFDAEEEEGADNIGARGIIGAVKGRGLFGGKGFGALGGGGGRGLLKKGGVLGASSKMASSKGSATSAMLMQAGDGSGFVFSPLKRRVRNLDDTLMG